MHNRPHEALEFTSETLKKFEDQSFGKKYLSGYSLVLNSFVSFLEFIRIKMIRHKAPEIISATNEFRIDKCLVPSLTFREDRRQFMSRQLDLEKINFDFVDAIHGIELARDEVPDNLVHRGLLPRLSGGQLGCLLTHENIWASMLNSNWAHLLVLEDDAVLESDFNVRLNLFFKEVPKDYDLFFIGVSDGGTIRKIHSSHVIEPYNISCTHGYVISRKGCKKILNLISSFPSAKPLDMMISELIKIRALVVYQSRPILCTQKGGFTSNIDPKYFKE